MIPVYQDKFFEPGVGVDKQRGNCFTAVIASLLELPLRAVPNFVEMEVYGGPNWWYHAYYYCRAMGKEIRTIDVRNPPINTFYEVGGKSSRGSEEIPIHHSVIYYNGKLVHDPHPQGDGVLTVESGFYLVDL